MGKHLETLAIDGPLLPGALVDYKTGMMVLGVKRTKFWSLVKEGKLTAIRMGSRCTRFRTDEILALING